MSLFQRKFYKLISLILATLLAAFCFSRIGDSHAANPAVWAASAMEDIQLKQSARKGEDANQVNLTAAKGEVEAFQIVVKASSGDLSNVDIKVSDLATTTGEVISQDNITLYREHYIQLDRPTPSGWSGSRTRGKDLYADALIPFVNPQTGEDIEGAEIDAVPFELATGTNQPIWVDIKVPRSATAGDYHGTYTVFTDHGDVTGQISLNVWNFSLPIKPSLNSFFDIWEDRGIEAQNLLLEHKVMSSQRIPYPDQEKAFAELGVTSVRLPFWSGANYNTCKMSSPFTVQEFEKQGEKYDSSLLRYVFSADEIDNCQNIEKPLKQWAKNIHQAGLKHLVVMKPRPSLYKDIDIWVVNPLMYREAKSEIKEVMEQGDQVWFYTGYSTDYSPLWHLDSPPINYRIPQGWIAQSLNLEGVLISRVDTWTEDPWTEVPIYVQSDRDYPGVEMFIYPGEKVGLDQVVPSIRLKRIREGVEDYEYVEILKDLGEKSWAIDTVRQVGRDWVHWTKNPDKLYEVRHKLGQKIHQLAS